MNIIAKKIIGTFFGVEGVEEYESLKKKGIITGFSFSALFGIEWGVIALAQALVTFLVKMHWTESEIFLLLWLGDMVFAYSIILASNNTSSDPTLMNGSRRLVDLAFKKSLIGGILIELFYFISLLVWAETSSFYIFFKKRMKSFPIRAVAFIIVAGIKMLIWTKIYMFGVGIIDAIWSLIK